MEKESSTDCSEDLKTKSKKKRKDPRIESEYFEEIEVRDPNTGKVSIQKVKIVRYKASNAPKPVGNKGMPDENVEIEDITYNWDFERAEDED